jgi:hypothetical protein
MNDPVSSGTARPSEGLACESQGQSVPTWPGRARRSIGEQGLLDPARLVETAVTRNMVRPNGRSQRGERLFGDIPMGHWETGR